MKNVKDMTDQELRNELDDLKRMKAWGSRVAALDQELQRRVCAQWRKDDIENAGADYRR